MYMVQYNKPCLTSAPAVYSRNWIQVTYSCYTYTQYRFMPKK